MDLLITKEQAEKIGNYLVTKPYYEVSELCNILYGLPSITLVVNPDVVEPDVVEPDVATTITQAQPAKVRKREKNANPL